jgi:hypothetical protein
MDYQQKTKALHDLLQEILDEEGVSDHGYTVRDVYEDLQTMLYGFSEVKGELSTIRLEVELLPPASIEKVTHGDLCSKLYWLARKMGKFEELLQWTNTSTGVSLASVVSSGRQRNIDEEKGPDGDGDERWPEPKTGKGRAPCAEESKSKRTRYSRKCKK